MGTLVEYRTRLDREPLTLNQLGRIHREFARLGYGPADRAERLRLTATLARVPGQLATTKDLTMGEAGRVVGLMTGCRTVRDLYALAEPEPEPRPWGLLAALLAWLIAPGRALPRQARPGPDPIGPETREEGGTHADQDAEGSR